MEPEKQLTPDRKNGPEWPSLKPGYQQLSAGDDVLLTGITATPPSSQMASATDYTPGPLQESEVITKKKWTRMFVGWKGGVKFALVGGIAVLIVNLVVLICIAASGRKMSTKGIYMINEGRCEDVERSNKYIHFAVNSISTLLLASSNYCMQLLSAPTRANMDKAHAQRGWLDVGILSIRNLKSLNKRRLFFWCLLAFSSIPLHLVYNSVFYTAIATNDYNVLYINEGFVGGAPYNKQLYPDSTNHNYTQIQQTANQFVRLTNQQCIDLYARDFIAERRNVLLVTKQSNSTSSIQKAVYNQLPLKFDPSYNWYSWICDDPRAPNKTRTGPVNEYGFVPCTQMAPLLSNLTLTSGWTTGGYDISYCYSELVKSECHVHFALPLMVVVVFFNAIKVIGILYVAYFLKEDPIITLGDAVQSFIQNPDRTTEGMCLISKADVHAYLKDGFEPNPIRFQTHNLRWRNMPSRRRWLFLIFLFVLVLVCTIISLGFGIRHLSKDKSITSPFDVGFGEVKPQNIIMGMNLPRLGDGGVYIQTLVANTPQVIFTFLYITYNSVITNMHLANEWARFGINRKYLRVSIAVGKQRNTYFLTLPYRYAVPLIASSGMLHYLISQTIFLANIAVIPADGKTPMQDEITTCAFSPSGMVAILSLTVVYITIVVILGFRRLPGDIPIAGSNSLAIAAACHVQHAMTPSQRYEVCLRPLQWGAVRATGQSTAIDSSPYISQPGSMSYRANQAANHGEVNEEEQSLNQEANWASPDLQDRGVGRDKGYWVTKIDDAASGISSENDENIGHCSFSDQLVDRPVVGKLYA